MIDGGGRTGDFGGQGKVVVQMKQDIGGETILCCRIMAEISFLSGSSGGTNKAKRELTTSNN